MKEQIVMPTVDQFITINSIPSVSFADASEVDPEVGGQACLEVPPKYRELHAKALAAVARWKTAEIELLQVLDEVETHKGYLRYGYNSLFQYAVKALGLSEGVAYNLINVGRAAREIPELKAAIASGELSVSKARKITSVITRENSSAWIELAITSSQHQVEREVSLANPRESGRGRMNYVRHESEIAEKVVVIAPSGLRAARETGSAAVTIEARVQLEVGVSEKLMIKIRRAQGLVGQKLRRGATLEETLEAMVEIYLSKHDPNERAKRQLMRGKLETPSEISGATKTIETTESAGDRESANTKGTSSSAQNLRGLQFSRIGCETTALRSIGSSARRPLPAATKHRVHLKFESRCSHVDHQGKRCQETKFLEIHHVKPLYAGGDDRLENLTLLCSGHHKGIHLG